jgi:hypothetical protein
LRPLCVCLVGIATAADTSGERRAPIRILPYLILALLAGSLQDALLATLGYCLRDLLTDDCELTPGAPVSASYVYPQPTPIGAQKEKAVAQQAN